MRFPAYTALLLASLCADYSSAFAPARQNNGLSLSHYESTTSLSMLDDAMKARLDGIRRSYQALTERLADPDVIGNSNLLRQVMKDRSQSEDVVLAFDEYCRLDEELEGANELFQEAGDDAEMREMARSEVKTIEAELEDLQEKITILLLPKDPNDDRNCMLEIRAGTGGSEANIFAGEYGTTILIHICIWQICDVFYVSFIYVCIFLIYLAHLMHLLCKHFNTLKIGDLYDVYRKFMSNEGWKVSTMDSTQGDDGGYKNICLEVKGDAVYSKLKWEAGVHRVQRVPATETQGRVHTSTATVAIMVSECQCNHLSFPITNHPHV